MDAKRTKIKSWRPHTHSCRIKMQTGVASSLRTTRYVCFDVHFLHLMLNFAHYKYVLYQINNFNVNCFFRSNIASQFFVVSVFSASFYHQYILVQVSMQRLLRKTHRTKVFGAVFGLPTLCYAAYFDWEEKAFHAKSIIRSSRVLVAAGKIAALYYFRLPAEHDIEKWNQLHSKAANILLNLFQKNSGVFIKLGQHLAALDYLIPIEYCSAMGIMFNQAPVSSIEDVKWTVEHELRQPMQDLFDEFDENPVGSASLAQVHVAKLKDTKEKVAVKVQHKFLEKIASVDISVAAFAFGCLKHIFPQFQLDWLAQEMRFNLQKEMDFEEEADNARKCAKIFENQLDFIVVPKIFGHLCSKKVLVMEYLDNACMITDVDKLKEVQVNPVDVIRRVSQVFCQMMFKEKFLHCDPHPGNLLIVPHKGSDFSKWRLGIIDHGLYFKISNQLAKNYANLWISIFTMDEAQIIRWCEEMEITGADSRVLSCMISQTSWSFLSEKKLLDVSTESEQNAEIVRTIATRNLSRIIAVLSRLPRGLLLMMKSNELLRNIERKLTNSSASNIYLKFILEYSFRNAFGRIEKIFSRETLEMAMLYLKFKIASLFV